MVSTQWAGGRGGIQICTTGVLAWRIFLLALPWVLLVSSDSLKSESGDTYNTRGWSSHREINDRARVIEVRELFVRGKSGRWRRWELQQGRRAGPGFAPL